MRFRAALAAGVLVVLAATLSPAFCQSYWYEDYQRIVRLIDRGQFQQAAPALEQLLRVKPMPAAVVSIPGDQAISYCPYFQRARIQHGLGAHGKALHSLDVARAFGEMTLTASDRSAFESLRQTVERAAVAEMRPQAPGQATETRAGALPGQR